MDVIDDVDRDFEKTEAFQVAKRPVLRQNLVGTYTTANAYKFYGRRRMNYRFD